MRNAANATVRPYLDAFPEPNGRQLDAQRADYVRQDSRDTDEYYVMGRVDHQFSPVNKIFVRYTFNEGEVTNPEPRELRRDHRTRSCSSRRSSTSWCAAPASSTACRSA